VTGGRAWEWKLGKHAFSHRKRKQGTRRRVREPGPENDTAITAPEDSISVFSTTLSKNQQQQVHHGKKKKTMGNKLGAKKKITSRQAGKKKKRAQKGRNKSPKGEKTKNIKNPKTGK